MARPHSSAAAAAPMVLLLALSLSAFADAKPKDAVDLNDVASLTFRRGKQTAGRRSAGVPQLSCVGGDACSSSYLVDAVQCHNTGVDDYGDVQWKCEADLEDSVRLGEMNVNCEGFSSRTDRLKLRGSCGLEYSLHYTTKGRDRSSSYGRGGGRRRGSHGGYPHSGTSLRNPLAK
mmetsp:Transcript_27742/g.64535  ORF Transcript_27742/g.64535 Transcript_27742/m.64535 type:complete len:175 (+) Transcript_27742:137-661(+)